MHRIELINRWIFWNIERDSIREAGTGLSLVFEYLKHYGNFLIQNE